jgi:protein SCO1/2
MKRALLGLFFVLLATAACGSDGRAQNLPEGHYRTRGVVREIRVERRSITIAHEDVPGYMPAMTMPFDVEDPALLHVAAVGERVEFTFSREEGGRHVIRTLRRNP